MLYVAFDYNLSPIVCIIIFLLRPINAYYKSYVYIHVHTYIYMYAHTYYYAYVPFSF